MAGYINILEKAKIKTKYKTYLEVWNTAVVEVDDTIQVLAKDILDAIQDAYHDIFTGYKKGKLIVFHLLSRQLDPIFTHVWDQIISNHCSIV